MIWNKIKTHSLLISVFALGISIGSLVISYYSLKMNKEEFEKRREARLFIDASWTGDKIYISRLMKSQWIESVGHEDLYEGLEGFIKLMITNTSDHTISIVGIRIGYYRKYGDKSIPWGSKFKSVDMQTDITFPIVLDPNKPLQCVTRVPIPISASLADIMRDLQSDTTYSSEDIFLRLAYYRIKAKAKSIAPDSIEAIIKKEIQFLAIITGGMQNVPKMLITCSDPNLTVRRGERALVVRVKLSSGELISQVLDFIDINESQLY